ncbi:FAD-dependent monooxygenase [Streptomyces sp. A5-4]|uniref:FAD-dependent monooxygenase n=1 Tax=Streptomyces sp. A5-4 TaxID=3384771 RepID=UPI003DA968E3
MTKNVLISGASIAGPALAYWLGRYGFHRTVVELAPTLRGGGQPVDFRGETHLTALDHMGVLAKIRQQQTGGSPIRFVDEHGRHLLRFPAELAGGELEILRGDLATVLHEHSLPHTEYIFGDSITSLTETAEGVQVDFRNSAPREFDLVIGADGLHSNVRRLAFGPEEKYVRHLGYYAAIWQLPNYLGLGPDSVGYNRPGLLAAVGRDHRDSSKANTFFIFAAPQLAYDRHDQEQKKALIAKAYAGLGWEVPRLLESLRQAPSVFFDSIDRADVDAWSTGRIGLVGDAACGAALGGMGSGTAIVGAYILAGELALAGDDHRAGFARYENRMRGYALSCQKGGDSSGKLIAPASAFGLGFRNTLLSKRPLMNWILKESRKVSSIPLPDYRSEVSELSN